MKPIRSFFLLVLLTASTTQAHADAANDAETMVGLVEKLGDAVEESQESCDKVAAAVSQFADANAATMKELLTRLKKFSDAQKKALKEKYGARLQAAVRKSWPVEEKCKGNAKLEAAFKKYSFFFGR